MIVDTDIYYRVSAVNVFGESTLSEPQTHVNSIEYQNRGEDTYTDSKEFVNDPHANRYPTGRQDVSYQGVNILPSNILRRYQFNTMLRKHLWLLEDTGEYVYLIKRKQTNIQTGQYDRGYSREDRVDFFEPVKIKMRMVSANETKNIKEQGLAYERAPRSWTLYTPKLADGDIVIDRENRRYEVQNVTTHTWRSSRTFQNFDIKQLEKTDKIYTHPQLNIEGRRLYS